MPFKCPYFFALLSLLFTVPKGSSPCTDHTPNTALRISEWQCLRSFLVSTRLLECQAAHLMSQLQNLALVDPDICRTCPCWRWYSSDKISRLHLVSKALAQCFWCLSWCYLHMPTQDSSLQQDFASERVWESQEEKESKKDWIGPWRQLEVKDIWNESLLNFSSI